MDSLLEELKAKQASRMARCSEKGFVGLKVKESRSKFSHCIFSDVSLFPSSSLPGAEKRVNRKKGGGPRGSQCTPNLVLDCYFSKQKLHCDEARLRRVMAHHKELLSRLAFGGGIVFFKHKRMIS